MSKKCKAYSESKLGLEPPDNRKAFYAGWDAALAAEQPKPEPVAWMFVNLNGECEQIEYATPPTDDDSITPLYTAPPDAEALRRDAERYRYLRNRDPKEVFNKSGKAAGVWIDWEDDLSGLQLLTGDDADTAIDAAMKEDKR